MISASRLYNCFLLHKKHAAAFQDELERCPQHIAQALVRLSHLMKVNMQLHRGARDQASEPADIHAMHKAIGSEFIRLQMVYEQVTGGVWELQHRGAYEDAGLDFDLLHSVSVLDLTLSPADYFLGQGVAKVEARRARKGGAGVVPPDLACDEPFEIPRPVSNPSRLPAQPRLFYDPCDGRHINRAPQDCFSRTPDGRLLGPYGEESKVADEVEEDGDRPATALEAVQRLIRLQSALARLQDQHPNPKQQAANSPLAALWPPALPSLTNLVNYYYNSNNKEPSSLSDECTPSAEVAALQARMQRLQDHFRHITGRDFRWECSDWCLGPSMESRNLWHAYLLLVGLVRPEDVLVEGRTAARIQAYQDFRASVVAFTIESSRRLEVDQQERYARTKHLNERLDEAGRLVMPSKAEIEQALRANPVPDLGPVLVPVLHGSIAHTVRASSSSADRLLPPGHQHHGDGEKAGDVAPCLLKNRPRMLVVGGPPSETVGVRAVQEQEQQLTGGVGRVAGDVESSGEAEPETQGGSSGRLSEEAGEVVVQGQQQGPGWWSACWSAVQAVGVWLSGLWGSAKAGLSRARQWLVPARGPVLPQ